MMPSFETLLNYVFTIEPSVLGVLLVGSHAVPQLVDEYSDVDLLVFVDGENIYEHLIHNARIDNTHVHWSKISLRDWMDLVMIDSPLDVPSLCYMSHTYDSLTWLYKDDHTDAQLEEYNKHRAEYRKQACWKFVRSWDQLMLNLCTEGVTLKNSSKAIHHLLRCHAILQGTEDQIDWNQLLRIKRIRYTRLDADDKEFIVSTMKSLLRLEDEHQRLTNC